MAQTMNITKFTKDGALWESRHLDELYTSLTADGDTPQDALQTILKVLPPIANDDTRKLQVLWKWYTAKSKNLGLAPETAENVRAGATLAMMKRGNFMNGKKRKSRSRKQRSSRSRKQRSRRSTRKSGH
jgi:hypothetical protein